VFVKGFLCQSNWVQRVFPVGVLGLIGLEKWQFFCAFQALVLGQVAGLCSYSWRGGPQKGPSAASNGTLAAVRLLHQQQSGMSRSPALPCLLAHSPLPAPTAAVAPFRPIHCFCCCPFFACFFVSSLSAGAVDCAAVLRFAVSSHSSTVTFA